MDDSNHVSLGSAWRLLRAEHDLAFRRWKAEVFSWQSLLSQVPQDRQAIEQARQRMEESAAAYRAKRDRLAGYILQRRPAQPASATPRSAAAAATSASGQSAQVRALAHQIWEESGRPSGSAEADWFEAERIVRRL
jgi:hypothetical protein